jgi:hypothetical protein
VDPSALPLEAILDPAINFKFEFIGPQNRLLGVPDGCFVENLWQSHYRM